MSRQIFTGGSPLKRIRRLDDWVDGLWLFGLLMAALTLFGLNLGGVPLRDWDESLVAQVAREIERGQLTWLYPTLHGMPYFNKPPFVHGLIAGVYHFVGISEWTARFPSAFLTALSIPILYSLGWELFRQRTAAIFSALVYLTFLPVVRQGRLAMLDGTILFLFLVMMWCVLRSRRDLRYALGSGLAFGLLCLTKGIALGILLGAIALIFLLWDTPRILTSFYLWMGLGLGFIPVAFWYGAQWFQYGQLFFHANLFQQSFQRVWEPVENHQGSILYYLLEICKYGWPWLLFLPQGLRLAWQNKTLSWAKLVLVWTGIYFVTVSLMSTKLPWYILPIYPAFALTVGRYLAEVWREGDPETGRWKLGKQPHSNDETVLHPMPDQLWFMFAFLACICWGGCLYFGGILTFNTAVLIQKDLQFIFGALALSLSLTAFLVYQKDRQFILVLFWGMFVSLLLFVTSNHWVWELGEDYPVKPVAEIVEKATPPGEEIFMAHPYSRPSLNFYSDRHIHAVDNQILTEKWNTLDHPYILIREETLKKLNLQPIKVLGTAKDWVLITRNR